MRVEMREVRNRRTVELRKRPFFLMGEGEFRELSDGSTGLCLACGEEACGVEPDARKYECESCGAPKVYGLEECLLMGRVVIDEGREDES